MSKAICIRYSSQKVGQPCKSFQVSLLLAFVETIKENFDQLATLTTPFLILHGDDDYLCNVDGSRHLVRVAKSKDKNLVEFSEAAHQLYLERPHIRMPAMARTVQWIVDRI